MAGRPATLAVRITGDASGAERGAQEAESRFAQMQQRLGAISAAAGAAAGAALAAGLQGALDVSKTTGLLQAQLGVTAKEAQRIGNVAGNLYSQGMGEGMEEVRTAVSSVIQNMEGMRDASSDVLKQTSERALTLSTVLGDDVGNVTKSVSQMMKTGLAKNAQEAFDILAKGAQNGANKSQDLLDTFNEYSTNFRTLGLSGQEAMGLIQQGLQGGARDADQVADSLKEFSLRATDGSTATSEAFKALGLNAQQMSRDIAAGGPAATQGLDQVLERLRGIEDPLKRSQLAAALFGTQAEDMGAALLKLDPSSAVSSLGDLSGATDKATQAMGETAAARFEAFKRGLLQDVTGAIMATVGWFQQHQTAAQALAVTVGVLTTAWAAYNVVAAVMTARTALMTQGTIANTIVTRIAAVATAAWSVVQTILNVIMSANPLGLVVLAIAALVAAVVLAYRNSETFRAIVQAAWQGIQTAAQAAWNFLRTVFAWLVDTLSGPATATWAVLRTAVTATWTAVSAAFRAGWAVAQTVFNALVTGARAVVTGVQTGWAWFTSLPARFREWIGGAVTAAVNAGARLITWARELPGRLWAQWVNMNARALEIGRDLVQGLINGVTRMAGALVNKMRELASNALDAAKNFLGIDSPSKKFIEIGEYVVEGFTRGIDERAPRASAAMVRMLSGSPEQIDRATEQLIERIKERYKGLKTDADDILIQFVRDGNRQLQQLADQRDAIVEKIKAAEEYARQTAEQMRDFALGAVDDAVGAQDLQAQLNEKLRQLAEFQRSLAVLASRGLDQSILDQIVQAGPEAAAELAKSLAGATDAEIKKLNDTAKKINDTSKGIGKVAADAMFDGGREAGRGYLAGLRAQQEQIEAEMRRQGRALANAVERALASTRIQVAVQVAVTGGRGTVNQQGGFVGGANAATFSAAGGMGAAAALENAAYSTMAAAAALAAAPAAARATANQAVYVNLDGKPFRKYVADVQKDQGRLYAARYTG